MKIKSILKKKTNVHDSAIEKINLKPILLNKSYTNWLALSEVKGYTVRHIMHVVMWREKEREDTAEVEEVKRGDSRHWTVCRSCQFLFITLFLVLQLSVAHRVTSETQKAHNRPSFSQ